jgi:hypothetical protein
MRGYSPEGIRGEDIKEWRVAHTQTLKAYIIHSENCEFNIVDT